MSAQMFGNCHSAEAVTRLYRERIGLPVFVQLGRPVLELGNGLGAVSMPARLGAQVLGAGNWTAPMPVIGDPISRRWLFLVRIDRSMNHTTTRLLSRHGVRILADRRPIGMPISESRSRLHWERPPEPGPFPWLNEVLQRTGLLNQRGKPATKNAQRLPSHKPAQVAVDGWAADGQPPSPISSLDRGRSDSPFRSEGATRLEASLDRETNSVDPGSRSPYPLLGALTEPAEKLAGQSAVELEVRVPPSGEINLANNGQRIKVPACAGRVVTIWVDLRRLHVSLDGQTVRTMQSRLLPEHLLMLWMRGARPAGPEPATPAPGNANDTTLIHPGDVIEVDRLVDRDGSVSLAGGKHLVGLDFAGRAITLRLDGNLMHAIADGALVGTWPSPRDRDEIGRIRGARTPTTPLPPPLLPAGALRVLRRVHSNGRIRVAGQNIKLGQRNRGKLVTVVIEDTHLRIFHGEEEIAARPRKSLKPITRLHIVGPGAHQA
ncbi:hypothetical protein ACFXG4_47620 [Nocardia sp. NPDC059246]|uniref:hypothetical protein n=1 Tax=unclassified Nocardia TaxID=2637762 RepID=UPI0036C7EA69